MPSARVVLRALFAGAGAVLVAAGALISMQAMASQGFPAGLALGLGILVFAAGGAVLGGAALFSGGSLSTVQRGALKAAGALAVLAFVLPAAGIFLTPDLLFDWFGLRGPLAALVAWLTLTLAAVAVGLVVAAWRGGELVWKWVTT
jgi:hypothetical protein